MKERANMERLFDKVLVTGGAGYCGARLVPQMLARGYKVTVYDIMFFGNQFLPRDNPNLRIIDGDIRDAAKFAAAVAGHDAVVNLACISNDASFELDEDLSTSIRSMAARCGCSSGMLASRCPHVLSNCWRRKNPRGC
jgi:nucleoside-diphosphate-sugar epimerase